MARKIYPYSLKTEDAKIAGVCSTLGRVINIDPTFLRLGFVASAIFLSFTWTLVAYAAIGLYLVVQKKRLDRDDRRMSDFDRMDRTQQRNPSIKAMRDTFDTNDRRMMAIDHHLNSQNDELAREIEALRQEDK